MTAFTPPDTTQAAPAGPPASFRTDPGMWRSYVTDLIYAAATGPASYAHEIQRRRHPMTPEDFNRAQAAGEAMGAELRAMFPDAPGIVRLARAATGEDEPTAERQRQRLTLTAARCARWLPKNPVGRIARPGGTPEERQARADALVAQLEAEDGGPA